MGALERRVTMASNVEAIKAQHGAFNDRDWEGMRELFADDCVFESPAGPSAGAGPRRQAGAQGQLLEDPRGLSSG